MHLRTLGCSGSCLPGHFSPAFLLDGGLLLDAGAVASVLSETEQKAIHTVLVTHSHLDHVKDLAHLADNLFIGGSAAVQVRVVGIGETLRDLATHLFNDRIWPDFTALPCVERPVIIWHPVAVETPETIAGYEITAIPVHHTVPAVGYRVCSNGRSLVYTGDTGPARKIWQYAEAADVLIAEVSLPNGHEDLCRRIGHLTPSMLAEQLSIIQELPQRILITHLKPHYEERIRAELDTLSIPGLQVMSEGDYWSF